jgi:hypothetical protein
VLFPEYHCEAFLPIWASGARRGVRAAPRTRPSRLVVGIGHNHLDGRLPVLLGVAAVWGSQIGTSFVYLWPRTSYANHEVVLCNMRCHMSPRHRLGAGARSCSCSCRTRTIHMTAFDI